MFDFYGRAGRLAFLGFSLLAVCIAAGGIAVLSELDPGFGDEDLESYSPVSMTAFILLVIGCGWMWLSAGVRRCHDLGWSGWWILLRLIPIVGLIQGLWLLFAPGEEGENEYGAQPA